MGCSESKLEGTRTGLRDDMSSSLAAQLTAGHLADLNLEHTQKIVEALRAASKELDEAKNKSVWDYYDPAVSLIGRGAYARVFKAYRKRDGACVAIKVISRDGRNFAEMRAAMAMKIACMRTLQGHPAMIGLHEVFEDGEGYHVVVDYCAGGAIFDQVVKKGHFTERDAAAVLRQLLEFIDHMHKKNVVHRDLKPENLMLLDELPDEEEEGGEAGSAAPSLALKVIDFGTAAFCEAGQHLHSKIGTARYVAPEVLARDYNYMSDIWSAGVIAYILLSGHAPFKGRRDTGSLATMHTLAAHQYDFENEEWAQVSAAGKDFIRHMLVIAPEERWTAEQLLQHEWFESVHLIPEVSLGAPHIARLHGFVGMCRMKRLALKLLATTVTTAEAQRLKEMFSELDTDGDGLIDGPSLTEGLKRAGVELSAQDVEEFLHVSEEDTHEHGINYAEFLAAMFDVERVVRRRPSCLIHEFEALDRDHDGFITAADLVAADDVSCAGLTLEEAEAILDEVAHDHGGRLNLEEFKEMMTKSSTGRLSVDEPRPTPPTPAGPTLKPVPEGASAPVARDDTAHAPA